MTAAIGTLERAHEKLSKLTPEEIAKLPPDLAGEMQEYFKQVEKCNKKLYDATQASIQFEGEYKAQSKAIGKRIAEAPAKVAATNAGGPEPLQVAIDLLARAYKVKIANITDPARLAAAKKEYDENYKKIAERFHAVDEYSLALIEERDRYNAEKGPYQQAALAADKAYQDALASFKLKYNEKGSTFKHNAEYAKEVHPLWLARVKAINSRNAYENESKNRIAAIDIKFGKRERPIFSYERALDERINTIYNTTLAIAEIDVQKQRAFRDQFRLTLDLIARIRIAPSDVERVGYGGAQPCMTCSGVDGLINQVSGKPVVPEDVVALKRWAQYNPEKVTAR
jgi:hypothetical protein